MIDRLTREAIPPRIFKTRIVTGRTVSQALLAAETAEQVSIMETRDAYPDEFRHRFRSKPATAYCALSPPTFH